MEQISFVPSAMMRFTKLRARVAHHTHVKLSQIDKYFNLVSYTIYKTHDCKWKLECLCTTHEIKVIHF